MKKLLNKKIFWVVFSLLSISLLDIFPIEEIIEKIEDPYLELGLTVGVLALSLLSFVAVILVFWVAYYAQGKMIALTLILSWILLGLLPDNFYVLSSLVVLGYWIYLKPEIQRYSEET